MPGQDSIYARSSNEGALRQGEIIFKLTQATLDVQSIRQAGPPVVTPIIHPWTIVMTQDCDLDWDYKARQKGSEQQKLIPSVLFCEVATAEELFGRIRNSKIWEKVQQNKDERYQFLQQVSPEDDALGEGLPELGIDFKRYFTIPTGEVYLRLQNPEIKRRCKLNVPYRDHLSTRFCYFQMRVALPAEHASAPE